MNGECLYTLATSENGFTGAFANVNVPNKWRVSVLDKKIILAYANGTVFLFR